MDIVDDNAHDDLLSHFISYKQTAVSRQKETIRSHVFMKLVSQVPTVIADWV